MTISIKSPTSTTGSIQKNGSDVLTIDSSDNVTVVNNLSVSGTVSSTGNVNFDSGTLYVDTTNNRVGVGTTSPNHPLEISSDLTPAVNILCTGSSPNTGLGITKEQGSGDLADWNAITINGNDNVSYEARIQWQFDSIANGPVIGGKRTGGGETQLAFHTNSGETLYERMRITSGGDLLVGTTTAGITNTSGIGVITNGGNLINIGHPNGTGSGAYYCGFGYNGSSIGSITQNGTTAVAYNTSSDYRLKENVAPMSGSIDRLKQLKPSTWSWIQDGSHGEGFLAHEAQTVVPEAIFGTKDAVDDEGNPVYQGIDQSKLVPLLTAALQEAITKIEDLEARIQALENPS